MLSNDAEGLAGQTWLVSITDARVTLGGRLWRPQGYGIYSPGSPVGISLSFATGIFYYLHIYRQRLCCCSKLSMCTLFSLQSACQAGWVYVKQRWSRAGWSYLDFFYRR